MFCKKVALISLISIATGVVFPIAPTFAKTLNQEINAKTIASEGVLYASKGHYSKHPQPHKPHKPHEHHKPHKPKYHQQTPQVHPNVNKTTVVTPVNSSSTANSSSNSHSSSHSNSRSASNSSSAVNNSGNSSNTNSNVSQGGNADSTSTSSIGDQQNQQSLTTNGSTSTKVEVDGDKYNSVHFGNQAPGTGSEAFSFQYRSACGASVNYRQGFALKPKRIAGGGFGFALDISSTSMDTIESREGVQNKMNTAFLTAMKVVDNQEIFQQRLNTGVVSYREAQAYAIANCAPYYPIIHKTNTPPKLQIRRYYINKPQPRSRVCTAKGCN